MITSWLCLKPGKARLKHGPAQIIFNNARPKTRLDDPPWAGKLTKTRPESFSFFIETDYKTF